MRKTFRFSLRTGLLRKGKEFSICREGADLTRIKSIIIKWYISEKGVELLPDLKSLVRKTGVINVKREKGLETMMQAMQHLSPFEQAWVEVATKQRKDIWDFGIELTPRKGLKNVEGGQTFIQQLLATGWKPVEFQIMKATTQQRKAEGKEGLKKLIFQLAFQKNPEKTITIPPEITQILARQLMYEFAHVWFNPIVFRSITVNFTKARFGKWRKPISWVITL